MDRILTLWILAMSLPASVAFSQTTRMTSPATRSATTVRVPFIPTTKVAANPEPSPTTLPAELPKWIEQLGADEWNDREAAQKKIESLGAAVAKRMEEVAATTADPEVRQRALAILSKTWVPDEKLGTLVTLHLQNASAREAYESLFAQAHGDLKVWPPDLWDKDGKKPVTIDVDKVTFWEAMQKLETQTGLTLSGFNSAGQLQVSRRGAVGAVSIRGPFKVSIERGMRGVGRTMMSVCLEPGMRVASHTSEAEVDAAFDASDNPVTLPAGRRTGGFGYMGGDEGSSFFISADVPDGAMRWKGHVNATLMLKSKKEEIDVDKAINIKRNIDGQNIMVHVMNPEPGDYFVIVISAVDAANGGFSMPARVTLVDAAGRSLSSSGGGSSSNGKRIQRTMEMREMPGVGPATKLVLEVPVDTRKIEIPFEFTNSP